MDFQLSIMIPTYNRRERLRNTLAQLEKQTNQDFCVVISDNCSDYNIYDVLEGRDKTFSSRVEIIQNRFNVGLDANVELLFLACETKWCWILSDDDDLYCDSVQQVIDEIKKAGESAWLWFPLYDLTKLTDSNYKINDLESMVEFLENVWERGLFNRTGDTIYLSNKIYNMDKMRPCIQLEFEYVYCKMPGLVPILKSAEMGLGGVFVPKIILKYNAGCVSWDLKNVMLGTRIMTDVPFQLSKEYRKRLLGIVSFGWDYVISTYLHSEEADPHFLRCLYHDLYHYFLPFRERIVFRVVMFVGGTDKGLRIIKWMNNFRKLLLEKR